LPHLRKSLAKWGRLSLGSLLVGLVLLLDAMAASPELHELIHADAGQADHQCAVTLFGHGQIDSSVVAVVPAAATALVPICLRFEISAFAPAIENLPAGRAPPAAVSSPV
jgi:hypothetical protein